jgi:hypothetical protein
MGACLSYCLITKGEPGFLFLTTSPEKMLYFVIALVFFTVSQVLNVCSLGAVYC